jgi:hypothetical protein
VEAYPCRTPVDPKTIVGTRCAGCWKSVLSSSNVMMARDAWVVQAGEARIWPSSCSRNASPAAIPQPSMSVQSFGAIQAKFGVVAALARSAGSDSRGTTWAAQYAGRSRTSAKYIIGWSSFQ